MVAEEDDPASWGPGNFPYQTSAGGVINQVPFQKQSETCSCLLLGGSSQDL